MMNKNNITDISEYNIANSGDSNMGSSDSRSVANLDAHNTASLNNQGLNNRGVANLGAHNTVGSISRGAMDPGLEAMRILEDRRTKARMAAGRRHSEASADCVGLSDIEDRIRHVGLDYIKMILSGVLTADEAAEKIRLEVGALTEEKNCVLEQAGYNRDYLDPEFTCDICYDAGFVDDANGIRRRCSCYSQIILEKMYYGSNIASLGNASFERFDPTLFSDEADKKKYGYDISPRESIIKIRDFAIEFVEAFKSGKSQDLYFFGRTGVGKTYICSCIARRFLDEGFTVLYMSAPSLFNTITEYRMKAFRDDQYKDASYRGIINSDLLIIDDLGTESITEARFSEFLTLLNSRTTTAVGGVKSTILSTNKNPDALRKSYDERIASRIIGNYKIIKFYGDDLRLSR